MDERDYKAMNDELKKPVVVLNDVYGKDPKNTDVFYPLSTILEAMEEYADQFKKQLKEKEEQLTKSNEMNERLYNTLGKINSLITGPFDDPVISEELYNEIQLAITEYQNSKK